MFHGREAACAGPQGVRVPCDLELLQEAIVPLPHPRSTPNVFGLPGTLYKRNAPIFWPGTIQIASLFFHAVTYVGPHFLVLVLTCIPVDEFNTAC